MSIDEFQHLWDGYGPGWTLRHIDHVVWSITFHFLESGPTPKETLALRELLDEFRDRPMSEVLQQLRGNSTYMLPRTLGNIEARHLTEAARRLGLNVNADAIGRSGYLPEHSTGYAMLIDDDELAAEVARRMIAAGVPVIEVHVDITGCTNVVEGNTRRLRPSRGRSCCGANERPLQGRALLGNVYPDLRPGLVEPTFQFGVRRDVAL